MSVGNPETSRSQETRYLTWPSLSCTMKSSVPSHTHAHTHTPRFTLRYASTVISTVSTFFENQCFLSLSLFLCASVFCFLCLSSFLPLLSGCSSSNGLCCGSSRNGHYHPRITGRVDTDERERETERVEGGRRGGGGQKGTREKGK